MVIGITLGTLIKTVFFSWVAGIFTAIIGAVLLARK